MLDIRPLTDADIDEVAALHLRTWQVAYAGIVPAAYLGALTHEGFRDRWRSMKDATTLVAVDDGTLVGFAAVGPYREDDGSLDAAHGELYALYVAPERWNTGAGRALIEAAEKELAGTYPDMRLFVLEENHRARRFYERAGLRPDGFRDLWRPRGTTVDLPELRYAKAL
ncbi:GNAT family N-acetyltransferase [Actinoplanes sp. NPDC049316]|uniref:GNAT family N-acetyltransferase n=1 Tax=Actinoplanes sp. NPDC049316 TaxID=3154727 RepID=UPI0034126435